MATEVPAASFEARPWRQAQRGGTREDRMLDTISVCLPARLAGSSFTLDADRGAGLDDAVRAVALLDADHGQYLAALSGLLLRTESVASSKIEAIEASVDEYARAMHGSRANASATAMVAAASAVRSLLHAVDSHGHVRMPDLLDAHRILMRDDAHEARHSGALRTMQNWIGGSDYSPRNAVYVPPPPDRVPELMDDLLEFVSRTDLPVALQVAISHAQFELIHPFTDGNGRIGRALINAILRSRGATRQIVVPVASVLVARRTEYFASLAAFRSGDAEPITDVMIASIVIAAQESAITAQRLRDVHDEWRSRLATTRQARAAGAPTLLSEYLLAHPVLDADEAHRVLGGSVSRTYAALERLHHAGIVEPLTERTRNQVWAARALLDELTDLDQRIQARAQDLDLPPG